MYNVAHRATSVHCFLIMRLSFISNSLNNLRNLLTLLDRKLSVVNSSVHCTLSYALHVIVSSDFYIFLSLGPFLEKLTLDRQLMNQEKSDENKSPSDPAVSVPR